MARSKLTTQEEAVVKKCLEKFLRDRHLFESFAKSVLNHLISEPDLQPLIHSHRMRIKSEVRARSKITKKLLEGKRGAKPCVTPNNLYEKINDLAGVRILHLQLEQFVEMKASIDQILQRERISIVEGPCGKCWDMEFKSYFQSIGVETEDSPSMYTSVHYVLKPNNETDTCLELQVRTLSEELWGEVSHLVGYEDQAMDPSVEKQLKVLARMTSGSTRLVDSIFNSYDSSSSV